jgi:hypothetical protein
VVSRDPDIPPLVHELIRRHLPTLEHAELLLALEEAGGSRTDEELSQLRDLDVSTVARLARDLHRSGIIQPTADRRWQLRLHPPLPATALAELREVYEHRPLALVRAIQARPSAVQSFAEAFRIRPREE